MLERFERFSASLSELSRYWHKISADEMAKYGLRSIHSLYLLTLYRHPEGVTAAGFCELCGRDKSDVSRMMTIMEEKGLVEKTGSGKSRYRGVFRLTEEGIRTAEEVRRSTYRAVELAGEGLTDEARAVFYDSLAVIVENLRRLSRDGLSDTVPAPTEDCPPPCGQQ